MGICCMAQETQTGALYQPRRVGWGGRWEGGSKGRGYMYTYGWFMLRFDRKQQNSVKQLSFNKKFKKRNLHRSAIFAGNGMSLIAAVGKTLFWITSMSIPISQGETKPIIFVENPIHKTMATWPGFFWHESSTDVWSKKTYVLQWRITKNESAWDLSIDNMWGKRKKGLQQNKKKRTDRWRNPNKNMFPWI